MLSPDHGTWPQEGRVGLCRAGEYAGRYLLLTADAPPGYWYGYIEERSEQDVGNDFPTTDDELLRLLEDWQVVWLKPEVDRQVEEELFGLRAEWRRARKWFR